MTRKSRPKKGVTQADLKQVDIDAEFKSSSSSDSSETESEDDQRPESTPEMLMRAAAVGGELAGQMTNKWISDNQTGLKYCYSGSEKKMYMWNPQSQSMYQWNGRGSIEFLWQADQGSAGQGRPEAVETAPAASAEDRVGEPEKVLWITY
ncbi:hypothetical protein Pmar_PMAR008445, partial [Perkinsus marinus ATCC 50983]